MTQDTLTTLRAALDELQNAKECIDYYGIPSEKIDLDVVDKSITGLRTMIAAMEAQEPVLHQYRWLNPANNPDDTDLMDWKLVEPRNPHMDTVQDRITELEAYRYDGRVVYEVRGLFAHAQPVEQPTEIERLTAHLKQANAQTEEFERKWYLACDELDALKAQPVEQPLSDAYAGAREDLAIWKKRALEAEATNRKFIAEINGPAYMGEPSAQPVEQPVLTEEQIKAEFGKLYPNDLPLIELAANNKDFVLEAIGARHHWAAFEAGARAIEQAIKGAKA